MIGLIILVCAVVVANAQKLPPGFPTQELPPSTAGGGRSEGCRDYSSSCRSFQFYCNFYSGLHLYCPLTCGLCADSSCRDDAGWCSTYRHYCSSYPIVMTRCQKTCDLCSSGGGGGVWGPYGPWGSCSKRCGGGKQTRSRTCTTSNCQGDKSEERSCNTRKCEDECRDTAGWCQFYRSYCQFFSAMRTSCRKTCGFCSGSSGNDWGDYGPWGKCSKTCGPGTQKRTRKCEGRNCPGKSTDERKCNVKRCENTYKWSDFGDWSDCSKECGGGTQTRTRRCLQGRCVGEDTESRKCNEQKCEDTCEDKALWCRTQEFMCKTNAYVANQCPKTCNLCGEGKWGQYGKWSTCSKTCGDGEQTRTRQCEVQPCDGPDKETRNCKIRNCRDKWGDWSRWGRCSKTCGGGEQKRTRVCESGNCVGSKEETQRCNEKACKNEGQCSVKCGGGTRYEMDRDFNTNKQYKKFFSCNNDQCRGETCRSGYERMKEDPERRCCRVKTQQCGAASRFGGSSRILGGTNADIEEFPWQASLRARGFAGFENNCGASIVSKRWLVTAGHCIMRQVGSSWSALSEQDMTVVVGRDYLSQTDNAFNARNVQRAVNHPNFRFPVNDIAMVKLKYDLNFNGDTIAPICISSKEPPVDSSCFITGFGKTRNSASGLSPRLKKATVEILSYDLCESGYRNDDFKNDVDSNKNKLICAGKVESSQDTCNGDSGGPLACQDIDTCGFSLYGVTSFGPGQCATARKPGMFSKVPYFASWIRNIMQT